MKALTDQLLNRDMEHMIESIFDVTLDNSLLLDHTSDIIRIYLNKAPFLLLKPSYCLNLNLLPQREEHDVYWEMVFHTQNTESEEILCNGNVCRGYVQCNNTHTKSDRVNRINEHNHENNPSVFHCFKVRLLSNEELMIPKIIRTIFPLLH